MLKRISRFRNAARDKPPTNIAYSWHAQDRYPIYIYIQRCALGAIGLATVGIQNKSLYLKAPFMLRCFPFLGDSFQCIAPLVADVDENGQMAGPALPWWDSQLEHHQNMHQLHPELSRIIMNHPDTCSSVMRAYTHNQTLLRSSAREGQAWLISSHTTVFSTLRFTSPGVLLAIIALLACVVFLLDGASVSDANRQGPAQNKKRSGEGNANDIH